MSPGTEWMERAECQGADPDLFFPASGEPTAPAKAICAHCEVRDDCLEYALAHPAIGECGVWGGTSEYQRLRMRGVQPRRSARSPLDRIAAAHSRALARRQAKSA